MSGLLILNLIKALTQINVIDVFKLLNYSNYLSNTSALV